LLSFLRLPPHLLYVVHQKLLTKGSFNFVADPTTTLAVPNYVPNTVITTIYPSGFRLLTAVEARLFNELLKFIDAQCEHQMSLLRRLVAILVVNRFRRARAACRSDPLMFTLGHPSYLGSTFPGPISQLKRPTGKPPGTTFWVLR
jgi:hypothetical protein